MQPLAGGQGITVQPLGGQRGPHPGAADDQLNLRHLLTLSDDEDYLAIRWDLRQTAGRTATPALGRAWRPAAAQSAAAAAASPGAAAVAARMT